MRLGHACLLILIAWGCHPQTAEAENRTSTETHAGHAHAGRAASWTFHPTAFSVEVRGHGRPVILIPGLGCPGSVWRGTVHHLHGYQTHQLTLAGFAGKPRIDEPLAKAAVKQLAQYIRDRHLVSPVIIGHSFGGFIAYWLAAREPRLVGPTIVVDSGAGAGPDDPDDGAVHVRDLWRNASDEQFERQVNDMLGTMSAKPDRLKPMLAEIAKSDRRAIGDAIYELSLTTVRDDLGKIRAPVLVVLADGKLQDEFRRQAEAIRHHEVVVIPDAGHFVMLDEPHAFFAAIDKFLARHRPAAGRRAR